MKATVNGALAEVVAAARRRRHADRLSRMRGLDLDKPKVMSKAWKNVHSRATVDGVPLRLAAFAIAVEKVARAATLRGYV